MLVHNMRGIRVKQALPYITILFVYMLCGHVSAQTDMQLTSEQTNINVIENAAHFIDNSGTLTWEQVQQPHNQIHFVPATKKLLSYGLTDAAIWIRGAVRNTTSPNSYLLFEYPNIDSITVYYREKGVLHSQQAGSHLPLSHKEVKIPGYSFIIPSDTSGKPTEFWVRVKSGNSVIIPCYISTAEGLWHSYLRMYATELIYAGIVLALLFYNLSLYVWIRDRSYLYYLGYLFTLGSFVLLYLRGFRMFMGQAVADFFCNYGFSMVAVSYVFGLQFAVAFLQGQVFAPKLSKILRYISYAMWILVVCNIAGWRTLVIRQEQLLSLLTPLFVIALAATAWRKKYKPAIYFLIAWGLLLGAIIYFALCVMGILPVETWTLHALTVGSGIEMILLSFALGFRYLLLKKETAALQLAGMEMMKEHNARLEKEVTLRTQELQLALADLTSSNKVKDKLLGIISHDFRAPLNNLYWLLEYMEPGAMTAERLTRLKIEVGIELKRISMTMDNILNWSLTQLKRIEPRPEMVSLDALFAQVTQETALAAKKKGITLENKVSPDDIVWADAAQLRLILLNLLHNAVKFTNTGGKVTVEASYCVQNGVKVMVSDNGIGMSREQVQRLMNEQNVQSRQGTARETGTGMGIILCKEFVNANGGELQVDSRVNEGTCFSFTLPGPNRKMFHHNREI